MGIIYRDEKQIRNTCRIEGKEHKYDICHSSEKVNRGEELFIYLGYGYINSVRGNKQRGKKSYGYFWRRTDIPENQEYEYTNRF